MIIPYPAPRNLGDSVWNGRWEGQASAITQFFSSYNTKNDKRIERRSSWANRRKICVQL